MPPGIAAKKKSPYSTPYQALLTSAQLSREGEETGMVSSGWAHWLCPQPSCWTRSLAGLLAVSLPFFVSKRARMSGGRKDFQITVGFFFFVTMPILEPGTKCVPNPLSGGGGGGGTF